MLGHGRCRWRRPWPSIEEEVFAPLFSKSGRFLLSENTAFGPAREKRIKRRYLSQTRSKAILNHETEAGRFAAMLQRSAALKLALAEDPEPVLAVVGACERAIRAGNKIMFCGNGGSAADAQHLATELLIRLRGAVARDSWPALALTLDAAAMSAAVNDFGIDQMFERPLRGLGKLGDVLVGITTSGRSANVLHALQAAREMGIVTVGFLGGDGGPALPLCDFVLLVPDADTARIQECHITLGHVVLTLLEDRLVA